MQQKATAEFDLQAKTLTIVGELQPETPPLHDALMELLHGVDQPEVQHTLVNNNNVLSYRVVFTESQGPSAQDLDISQLNKQLQEANSTIALLRDQLTNGNVIRQLQEANSTIAFLEDRLAAAGKVAQMATQELAAIKNTAVSDQETLNGPTAVGPQAQALIEPAPSND